LPPRPNRLSFSATVPRHLVHRRAVSEVLLTDWCQNGTDAFVCAAQWSRSHSFYRVRNGRHDPLLLAETIRQAGLLLCHEEYQVPPGHCFLMHRMEYDTHLDALAAGAAPAEVVLAVRVQELRRTTRSVTALRLDVEFHCGTIPIGRGAGWVQCVEPVLYKRIRSAQRPRVRVPQQRPAPVPPAEVGLVEAEDVVLGLRRQPGTWPLRVVTEHPVLFDHPLDHIPGMLVLEGMRQAGRALLGWPKAQPTACDVTLSQFIEPDVPSVVHAEVRQRSEATATVLMALVQAENTAAQGTVMMNNIADDGMSPDRSG
jgi:hypothetical protein